MLETVRSPLIIIGMHRSGTSLVVQCLERLGWFAGAYQDTNDEVLLFQKLNTWVLAQCHGGWEHPLPVHDLLRDAAIRAAVTRALELPLASLRVVEYLGPRLYLRHCGLRTLDRPWGWKDPANTFTLPLWLDVFPGARVLHVRRHGVDVASSLKVRHDWLLPRAVRVWERRRWLYRVKLKRRGFANVRVSDLGAAFELWEEYLREAVTHVSALGQRARDVRYEDFLKRPRSTLEEIAAFAGLKASSTALDTATEGIRPDRAFAYAERPELVDFARRVKPRLEAFGYDAA